MAHLNIDERFKIYKMNKSGYSSRHIGKKIGRDKSTICCELKKIQHDYRPDRAHALTLDYRTGKRKKKLDVDGKLRIEIIEQLKLGIAPDVISGIA